MSAELNHFRRAQNTLRASLLTTPAVLLAIAAVSVSQPVQAGDFEYLGRSIGGMAGSAAVGSQSQFGSPAAQAASMIGGTLAGRLGKSYDDHEEAQKRAQSEDAKIEEAARREVLYEAARRREAERQGIPYEQLSKRAEANAAGYYGAPSFSALDDSINRILARARAPRPASR